MRALKQETARFNIATSVIAPGITLTPILNQGRDIREMNATVEEWGAKMQRVGVPINKAESIGLAVGFLINGGMQSNGMGILIQADRMADLEKGIAKNREAWMGKEMLDLFRGGRDAPLFPRVDQKAKI
jgi:NAD(P)-dependent dehydrogenase (short-subunit alcohol dehydrogenase family)